MLYSEFNNWLFKVTHTAMQTVTQQLQRWTGSKVTKVKAKPRFPDTGPLLGEGHMTSLGHI